MIIKLHVLDDPTRSHIDVSVWSQDSMTIVGNGTLCFSRTEFSAFAQLVWGMPFPTAGKMDYDNDVTLITVIMYPD